jgi:hypothetical protein
MPPHSHADVKPESVADTVSDMTLDPGRPADGPSSTTARSAKDEPVNSSPSSPGQPQIAGQNSSEKISASAVKSRSQTRSPVKAEPDSDDMEQKVGGDITVKLEPGKPPKLSRSSSQKVIPRPPQLFNHLPDSLDEACSTFDVIEGCIYANKYMGYTEHAMECDCSEEWGKIRLAIFQLYFSFDRFLFFSAFFAGFAYVGGKRMVSNPSFFSSFEHYSFCPLVFCC